MCYSRESFCKCCKILIKVLKVNFCNKSTCAKVIYSKVVQKCEGCSDCKFACSLVKVVPRRWVQKSDLYINGFGVDNKLINIYICRESKYTNKCLLFQIPIQ